MDAEEDEDAEDLGAPVVKGDEKKADAAKKVKQDGSIKSSQKVTKKLITVKEETESDEEELSQKVKKLKRWVIKTKCETIYKSKGKNISKMEMMMKKMKKVKCKRTCCFEYMNERTK